MCARARARVCVCGLEGSSSKRRPVAGPRQPGNVHSGSINSETFLDDCVK
jgi:hypothetical protein